MPQNVITKKKKVSQVNKESFISNFILHVFSVCLWRNFTFLHVQLNICAPTKIPFGFHCLRLLFFKFFFRKLEQII